MTGARPRRSALTALAVVGAIGAAAAVWGIGIERHLYTVRRHTVPILEPGSDPLRILHLSDVHMAPWQHRKQRWLASLAALKPDLIVNTGDNLGHLEGLDGVRSAFTPLRGIPGLFVHGSNDFVAPSPRNPFAYFAGPSRRRIEVTPLPTDDLDSFLEDLGWHNIENASASLTVRGHRIDAFGVGDAHHDDDELDLVPELAEELRDGDAATHTAEEPLTLAVAHAPYRRVLDTFTANGADVIFAGHTHGGQVRVPGYGALVANCDLPLSQARGLSTWTRAGRTIPLNVSAGVGHSIYAPVRFACRPEVSLITLVAA